MNNVDKARQIIADNRYLTLSTAYEGKPWVAPLAFVVDEDYCFYWYSTVDSRHSRDITQNPIVAVAIFNSTLSSKDADGLQMEGLASVVEDSDLERVSELYWTQSFPNPIERVVWKRAISFFKGAAIQRFYRFVPHKIYKLDTNILDVDRRVEIDKSELCRYPAHKDE